jgi:hypothetical protein
MDGIYLATLILVTKCRKKVTAVVNPWTNHRDAGVETLEDEESVQPRGKMPILVISSYRQPQ